MQMLKRYARYHTLWLVVVGIFLMGCEATAETAILPSPTPVQIELTHTSTTTEIPLTVTPTPSQTSTATPTPTEIPSSTPTATSTSTPEPAMLSLTTDTACMSGASFYHRIQKYVNAGTEFSIVGRLSDQSWWLVSMDEADSCWIFGEYASVWGITDALPVLTPPPIPIDTPTATPGIPGIYYILIAKDTGGPIGCGDSLIRYYPGVWVKGDMEDDIKGALNALFANHNQYIDDLYNPIYKSDIKAKDVEEVGGDVVVRLAGTFVRPKDTCESKRMHAQIWYTVSQFSPVRAVIYMNNALLGDLLVVTK